MAADVDSFGTDMMTSYVVTGTKEEVQKAVECIQLNYHPMGYGTTFTPAQEIEPGKWQASGHRYNSCD